MSTSSEGSFVRVEGDLVAGHADENASPRMRGPFPGSGRGHVSSARSPKVLEIPPKQEPVHVNLMVVGASGLGKTTFIQQMFQDLQTEDVKPHDGSPTKMEDFAANPEMLCTHLTEPVQSADGHWMVHYHVQDTPGHGSTDNAAHMQAVIDFIKSQKREHLRRQKAWEAPAGDTLREARNDLLPDLVLYFIAPHRFTPMDLEYIKRLDQEVTVAPICAKADAMTPIERRNLQDYICQALTKENVPEWATEGQVAAAAAQLNRAHDSFKFGVSKVTYPFVLVASNQCVEAHDRLEPRRVYPWGSCNINDPSHSDFNLLRQVILTAAFHTLRSKKQEKYLRFRHQLKQEKHEGGPSSSADPNAAASTGGNAHSGWTAASPDQPEDPPDHGSNVIYVTAADVLHAEQSRAELAAAEARAARAEAWVLEIDARRAEADGRAAAAEARALEIETKVADADGRAYQATTGQAQAEQHVHALLERAERAEAQLAQQAPGATMTSAAIKQGLQAGIRSLEAIDSARGESRPELHKVYGVLNVDKALRMMRKADAHLHVK